MIGGLQSGFVFRAGEVCQPRFVRVYDRPARDSDVESDDDLISSENDSDSESDVTEDRSAQLADDVTADTGAQAGWLSWCEILWRVYQDGGLLQALLHLKMAENWTDTADIRCWNNVV